MKDLESLRLELDSRRRTVDHLSGMAAVSMPLMQHFTEGPIQTAD